MDIKHNKGRGTAVPRDWTHKGTEQDTDAGQGSLIPQDVLSEVSEQVISLTKGNGKALRQA